MKPTSSFPGSLLSPIRWHGQLCLIQLISIQRDIVSRQIAWLESAEDGILSKDLSSPRGLYYHYWPRTLFDLL
jgi:hypothetical protein